jgi:thioester reductase-like protein
LAVLIRPSRRQSAAERLEEMLSDLDLADRELPVCLVGDVTKPGLGLSAEGQRWLARNCAGVVHSAACLTFNGSDRAKDPWLTNLTGTQHVEALCRAAGIRTLHYISTAYVCGAREGVIYEAELDLGQSFRNDYENSKLQAETLVRQSDAFDSLTVYRPAVIVGDSQTGFTSTYHGLYRYFQYTWLLSQLACRDADGRWHHPIRLRLDGQERHNLVPVDWCSAVISHLLSDPAHHGKTYHLGPRQATRAHEIQTALTEYFNIYGVTFAGPTGVDLQSASESERFFYQYISMHDLYLQSEPVFDCANTLRAAPGLPCPILDQPRLRRLIDFGVQQRFGKRNRTPALAAT